MSIGAVKDVIDGKMVLGPEREIQEVKNAYEAYEMIGSVSPYKMKDLLKLHGVMEKGWNWKRGIFVKERKECLMVNSVYLCHQLHI